MGLRNYDDSMLEYNPWVDIGIKITCSAIGARIGGPMGALLTEGLLCIKDCYLDKHDKIIKEPSETLEDPQAKTYVGMAGIGGLSVVGLVEGICLYNNSSRITEMEKIIGLEYKDLEWNFSTITRFNGFKDREKNGNILNR
jgi:hypothetical protein